MIDPKRAVISLFLVASLVATILFTTVFPNFLFAIMSVSIQIVSLSYYVLSYVPYGKEMCTKCLKSCFSCCFESSKKALLENI